MFGGGHGLVFAEGVVDGVGVGEGFHEVRRDKDDVGAFLDAVVDFAAHGFGKVELGAWCQRVLFGRFLHRRISAAVAGTDTEETVPEMVLVYPSIVMPREKKAI